MDEAECVTYTRNSIFPLYPNCRDVPDKHVLIKLDSLPGWWNIVPLTELRANGFILWPGVPNSTDVTQELDRNYRTFNTALRQFLDRVVHQTITKKLYVSLIPILVGLIISYGIYPKTGYKAKESPFKIGFSWQACFNTCTNIGACPLIMNCVNELLLLIQSC